MGPAPTATAQPVTESSPQPGVPVTPDEARDVATRLWQARMTARYQRDGASLRVLESGPALEADLGYICSLGCRGPLETAIATTVNVPPQTAWPADFFAVVSYDLPDCPVTPCDEGFVAVQASQGAPYGSVPGYGTGGFALPPDPEPSRQFQNLPAEYAQYLQSLKDTGRPPALTRLSDGAFTTDLATGMYNPPAAQAGAGRLSSTTYSVDPNDPLWRFRGVYDIQVTCGTVRYQDTIRPLPGQQLVQPPDYSVFGELTPGAYSSVVVRGLHMVCFEAYNDPREKVGVFGTWGDITHVSGTLAVAT